MRNFLKRKRKREFFLRDACCVAESILGDYLLLRQEKQTLAGRIVETEGYLGRSDDASHSFGGKITERNKLLYGEGGIIYVYLIYGKFFCFNIVVSKKDDPQAVFIRALEPLRGIELMKKRRNVTDIKKLTNGPCRWTQSFGINKHFLGKRVTSPEIFVSSSESKQFEVVRTQRIGVDYATQSKMLPLRFYIKGNPFVSRR